MTTRRQGQPGRSHHTAALDRALSSRQMDRRESREESEGPGIEEQAGRVAEAACGLADATAGPGWSPATATDVPVTAGTRAAILAETASRTQGYFTR
ncbi:hypothetical protein Shyd_84750 [Streptomyces hydrogenans]|uniref:Uncharacterized protein n=1 Tax=Streptomyces hydrogenans TaxID=1873719 RepID=A0ABQ3PCJ1_9ACTN|nr:hypothetical protein GCM10018784_70640 [Streptomyces hydrogenans]GHI22736.1 hypothetical protein Shyd_41070 [Streptomyces hydrogenans]GHI24535.1 hypothetical protein Shyd_59060 [Streptomyces hydrogenans]GHI24557.1 hypothetical protein Shyd_59280 [Streptomyces hydrogenans]GHI25505.1 hypothetical protein Shyd_68760 [Streptomyces hydrogenans]